METIAHGGQRVPGFALGALWSADWREPGAKLAAMDRLIAAGRGDELVEGGGCTEPGGGIVPTTRTAREMAALLRRRNDPGVGHEPEPAPRPPSPWRAVVVGSIVAAATGWAIEEVARRTLRKWWAT